jgi:hypothetical protein
MRQGSGQWPASVKTRDSHLRHQSRHATVARLSLTRQSATNPCGVTMPLGHHAQLAHVAEWHVAEWHVAEWHVAECQHASMPARLAARLEGERRGREEGEKRVWEALLSGGSSVLFPYSKPPVSCLLSPHICMHGLETHACTASRHAWRACASGRACACA